MSQRSEDNSQVQGGAVPQEKEWKSPQPRVRRATVILLLLFFFLVAGGGAGFWWHTNTRFQESTDDAYVGGNILRIMPQVNGKVVEVLADEGDRVRAGQPLIRLDQTDARLDWERTLVDLAAPVRDYYRLKAQEKEIEAAIAMRKVDLRQQEDNLARRSVLGQNNAIGKEELTHARDGRENAKSALDAAEAQREALLASLGNGGVTDFPAVRTAMADARDKWLAYKRTEIYSPAEGVVARRGAQAGEVVAPGAPLMAVVPVDHVWVDANFKEVQLRRIRIGQKVEVKVDLYGDVATYHGTVAGVSAGTGSVFSLIPAQNATGNWIKIVQRVPVRIEIDKAELEAHPLLLGLSTLVTVDTSDLSGPLLSDAARARPLAADMSSRAPVVDFTPAEEAMAAVIAANTPTGAGL